MVINLQDLGAVGDGVTDNYAVIQGAFDAAPDYRKFYLPEGNYRTCRGLSFGSKALTLVGDAQGYPGGYLGGSRLFGTIEGPVLATNYPSCGATISDLGIANLHATGSGLQIGGNNVSVDRLAVSAFKGIVSAENVFVAGIRQVVIRCATAGVPFGSIGIQVQSHVTIHAADVAGFDHGFRIAGVGVGVRDVRAEVCRVGIFLGMNAAGQGWVAHGTSVDVASLEANDIGIHVKGINASTIANVLIQGTPNSPSGASQYGIFMEYGEHSAFQCVSASGNYAQAAIKAFDAGHYDFRNVRAQNGSGVAWDVPPSLHTASFN